MGSTFRGLVIGLLSLARIRSPIVHGHHFEDALRPEVRRIRVIIGSGWREVIEPQCPILHRETVRVSPDVSIRCGEDFAPDTAIENLVIVGKEFSARSNS